MADDLDDLIAKRRKAMASAPSVAPSDTIDTLIAQRRAAIAQQPQPGLGERVLSGVGKTLRQIVTHPIDTARSMGEAALSDLSTIGENMNAGMGQPNRNTPEIARALPGALARTTAAAAFPGIQGAVSGRLGGSLMARGAGTAVGGAVTGAVSNPHDPLAGAATGALVAPVLGVAGEAAARGAGAVGGRTVTALGLRPTGRTAAEMTADASAMQRPVGPEGAATPAMSAAAETAPTVRAPLPPRAPKVRAAVGRSVEATGIESAKTVALRELAKRFELDNVTPADAVAFARQNATKPLAPLDLGGGNVAGLARLAKDTPGLARRQIPEFLHGRSSGADGATLQRVTQDFETRIGLKPEDYYKSVEDMTGKMKSEAAKNYGKVRGTVVDDPEVLSLFNEPEWRGVHERIRTNARIGGQEKIPALTSVSEAGGESVTSQNPQTIGTLDKMKRHLDKVITGKIEGGPLDKDQAFNMRTRLNAALDRLDELHPDYKNARAAYRGSAEAIDAYESGKSEFMKLDPRAIQAKLAKMPERLQDLYRRGGYDALRSDKLTKMDDGANFGAFLEKNPDIRDRVAALAKNPDDAAALRGDLGVERSMGERKNQILGGPNTAERLIEHWSTIPAVTQVGNLARKVPVIGHMGGGLVDNVLSRRLSNQTGDVMGEVGKLMTQAGPDGVQALMEALDRLRAEDAAKAITRQRVAGAVGVSAATQQRR
jgi:hypothetical protein